MLDVSAKITSKGQITLPRALRELLGVQAGDSVRFSVRGGQVVICPGRDTDFSALIGAAPLGPEWDELSAVALTSELRGTPEERASLQAAGAHPNVTRLGDDKSGT